MHRISRDIARRSAFALVAMAGARRSAQAQTEIQWWHAMTGANNELVDNLAKEFNATQSDYKVVPVYKGTLPGNDERRHRRLPRRQRAAHHPGLRGRHRVMMGAKGAIKPVDELMKEAGEKFDQSDYLPTVTGYYSAADGKMLSIPVQQLVADPVLQQGRLPEGRARPREAAEDLAGDVRVRQEDQGVRPILRHDQGVADLGARWRSSAPGTTCPCDQGERPRRPDAELKINGPLHIRTSRRWPNCRRTGPSSTAAGRNTAKAVPQRRMRRSCMTSSGLPRQRRQATRIRFRHRPLPYYPDAAGAPQNTIIGGASAVGHGRQDGRRVQGRRQVLHLPVQDRRAG